MFTYEDGWRKVSHSGGSYVVGTLYNILTSEEESVRLRDYEYEDGSRDDDYWYNAPIDTEAQIAWRHNHGILCIGDQVEVFKGRKIPRGTTGKIVSFRNVHDAYGRWCAEYAVFDNGLSTNVNNCRMVTA